MTNGQVRAAPGYLWEAAVRGALTGDREDTWLGQVRWLSSYGPCHKPDNLGSSPKTHVVEITGLEACTLSLLPLKKCKFYKRCLVQLMIDVLYLCEGTLDRKRNGVLAHAAARNNPADMLRGRSQPGTKGHIGKYKESL